MDPKVPENKASTDVELEVMMQDLLKAQLALGKSVSSTSQLLRFVLTLASENLEVIRSQLKAVRDLALEIDRWGSAS